ncbi:MAG: TRAM domain-containing protein, partial [Candidatus Atribacteria bacterium]|nr:TRAM domain-containing protein [Candidatus Atribacteria bacterium]
MIQKNEIIEGEVVDFALPECTGVLRQEGLVIFVPGVLPGERCRVIIKKVKKNLAEGEVSDILVSSPFRVSPPCLYFLDGCGGCSLQYIDYSEQVKIKEQNARVMLARLGGVEPGTYINDGFISSPRSLEYRNKMEFNFGEKNGRLLLGLRPKKR